MSREIEIISEAMDCSDGMLWRFDMITKDFWIQKDFYNLLGMKEPYIVFSIKEVMNIVHEEDLKKTSKDDCQAS